MENGLGNGVLKHQQFFNNSKENHFSVPKATYMASGRDVIVAKIDLHGSQGSGHLLRNSIYRQPGVLEAVDLIQTTKYVPSNTFV